MTRDFVRRLMLDRTIDTRMYRYIVVECSDSDKQWAEIRRIELSKLDTTAALTDWETVKRIY